MKQRKWGPRLKKDWVAALRSGDYKQGQGTLCEVTADGKALYCCLGVLAEVAHGEDVWVDPKRDHGMLSARVNKVNDIGYYGLHKDDPNYLGKDVEGRAWARLLADKNDEGKSFDEIADYIEANVPA